MEKAILKTLIYADIFDYPLKINEIQKWLIGRKTTLRQVEKALGKLVDRLQVTGYRKYYFLPKRKDIVSGRLRKARQSEIYLRKVKLLSQVLKAIPWIKLVGISGGLALGNASKKDDIDLFIITAKDRLWISRLLALGILTLIGQRRKVGDKGQKIAGKLCLNILLEEDRLEQLSKDIFIAHEVLQMKPLWQRDGVYGKYLEDNGWALKFLPNWMSNFSCSSLRSGNCRRSNPGRINPISRLPRSLWSLAMTKVEGLAKSLQMKIMVKPKGMERIEDGALYFHPADCRSAILVEYGRRVKKLAPLDK